MRGPVRLVCVIAAFVCASGWAGQAGPTNMLRNPGFESASGKTPRDWSVAGKYWPGKLAAVTGPKESHSGRRCVRLTATALRAKHYGRAYQGRGIQVALGARYRAAVWACGRGQLVVGCIEYRVAADEKRSYIYMHQPAPADLSAQWQQVLFDYTPQDPTITVVRFYVEVRGEGAEALLDDASFGPNPEPGFRVTFQPSHTMAPTAGAMAIDVDAKGPDGPAAGTVTTMVAMDGAPARTQAFPLQAGRARCTLESDQAGVAAVTLVHTESGMGHKLYVDVVDPQTYARFAEVAAKTRVTAPAHLVFVGDSLTALFRGYNYVDKVRGWVQHVHGREVKVTNAGVGGDYTTRVLARLDRDVIAIKPTHVFVFLGHNDSKLKSTTDYKEPVVPAEQFGREYREIVQRIQKQTGARVTIISATSSVYEITKASADKRAAAGRAHNLFGKPEALEQFNAIARGVARDLGADYLDVYEPTRTHPDKPSLFTRDGVHVSNLGNQLLALEILRYLCQP